MAKKRTINLMISEDADTRLRALSAELKLAMGAIIEQAILQWRPDTATPIECMPITDAIEARFNAMESRLQALEAERGVRTGAVEEVTVGAACEPVDVVLETVGAEPGIEVAVKEAYKPADAVIIKRDIEAFKKAAVTTYLLGVTGFEAIARKLTTEGYRNLNGNPYTRDAVRKHLIKVGLVKV